MDNLADLLAQRQPSEPPEIQAIKNYVQQHFKQSVQVMVRERDVVITVRSSALAGALRMRTVDLTQLLDSADKRLVFRVGRVSA
jgi:hypothetical protein